MTRSRLHTRLIARATAWLLVLVCGWMGTDGVLHHTDGGAFSRAASKVHHTTAAAPADACAACQWTQGMQTGPPVVCQAYFPLFVLHPRLQPVLHRTARRVLRRASPRAPPLFPTC